MGCCKDPFGVFLVILTHIILFGQITMIYYSSDEYAEEKNKSISQIEFISYLPIHKLIFYMISVFVFCCHLKATTTDPGRITHYNNYSVIEYYYELHEKSMKNAQRIIQSKGGEEEIKKMIFQLNETEGEFPEESEDDDYSYDQVTSITDNDLEEFKSKYKMNLTRCIHCYVVRPNRAHHCAICKGCVMGMDHHCPWINNCVGVFNKKFFIQFNFYTFIGCLYSIFICVYYNIYKNFSFLINDIWNIIFVVGQLLLSFIFGIFSIIMIKDLYDSLDGDSSFVDYKLGKLYEKRSTYEEFYEVMGSDFGFSWFLPFKQGGFRFLFNLIHKKIYEKND